MKLLLPRKVFYPDSYLSAEILKNYGNPCEKVRIFLRTKYMYFIYFILLYFEKTNRKTEF